MKAALAWLRKAAANPIVRPVEVWALRAIFAYAAAKLGIDLAHKA